MRFDLIGDRPLVSNGVGRHDRSTGKENTNARRKAGGEGAHLMHRASPSRTCPVGVSQGAPPMQAPSWLYRQVRQQGITRASTAWYSCGIIPARIDRSSRTRARRSSASAAVNCINQSLTFYSGLYRCALCYSRRERGFLFRCSKVIYCFKSKWIAPFLLFSRNSCGLFKIFKIPKT